MAELSMNGSKAQRLTALLRRSARWLDIAKRPYQLNALQRILAVYTRWCNAGYLGYVS
jgi:hypothetical protein